MAAPWCDGPSTSASRISTSPTITARRRARPRRLSDGFCGTIWPHRDELIVSTKAGYLMWPGPYGEWGSPQVPAGQPRPKPAAAWSGLCRHLLLAPLRPRDAARGDDGGARSGGPVGQGALCRHLILLSREDRGGGGNPAPPRHALPDPPADLLDAQPLDERTACSTCSSAKASDASPSRRWRRAC